MVIISLDSARQRKAQKLYHAMRATCSLYNTLPANKLNKVCVHCKFQNSEHCPKKGQGAGLTAVLPFRIQKKSLA